MGLLHAAGEIRANQVDFKATAPSQQPVTMPVNQPAALMARYHKQMALNGDQTSSPPSHLPASGPLRLKTELSTSTLQPLSRPGAGAYGV